MRRLDDSVTSDRRRLAMGHRPTARPTPPRAHRTQSRYRTQRRTRPSAAGRSRSRACHPSHSAPGCARAYLWYSTSSIRRLGSRGHGIAHDREIARHHPRQLERGAAHVPVRRDQPHRLRLAGREPARRLVGVGAGIDRFVAERDAAGHARCAGCGIRRGTRAASPRGRRPRRAGAVPACAQLPQARAQPGPRRR